MTTTTGPGTFAAQPLGQYQPASRVASDEQGVRVTFEGRDGRTVEFRFAPLPLPQWHLELAHAFAARTAGTEGTLATRAGADGLWQCLQRFLRFLDTLPRAPCTIAALKASHLERFRLHRSRTLKQIAVVNELRAVLGLLDRIPNRHLLRPEVRVLFTQALLTDRRTVSGLPGYDDATRDAILKCARSDAVRIARRLKAGEDLVARFLMHPETLPEVDRELGASLAAMAESGRVPIPRGRVGELPVTRLRYELARQLFLTNDDLAPLIVLGVLATGWNGETIKELPAAHRVLEGRAVVLEAVKRRRGPTRWFEEMTVEIGKGSERFTTAGGYYLFIERLTRRGRQFSRSNRLWSIWVGDSPRYGNDATFGHIDPFARRLGRSLKFRAWARQHAELAAIEGFELSLNRLKTTEERRYTRATGGHLPSAARTNSQDVLFSNYLSGDPVVQEWAADVVSMSLADAEAAARAEHRRLVEANGKAITVLRRANAEAGSHGRQEAAFTACTDYRNSPFNSGPCAASFLQCFACRNALSTVDHLPSQLVLLDELAARWEAMDREMWWRRFGQVWLAITEDILPRFTPAELEAAGRLKPDGTVLELLEDPQEEAWI